MIIYVFIYRYCLIKMHYRPRHYLNQDVMRFQSSGVYLPYKSLYIIENNTTKGYTQLPKFLRSTAGSGQV